MQCLRVDDDEAKVSKADTVRAPNVQSSRSSRRDRSIPETLADGRFTLHKKLGEGSFGMVFIGIDSKTQSKVAIKLEHQKSSAVGQLSNEARLLKFFATPHQQPGFAELLYFGKQDNYAVLAMDLLGLTIEDAVQTCGGKLEYPSVAMMAEQAIHLLAYVHSKAIVHRDIKSENFMWGIGNKVHHLYVIDFGMSTRYFMKKHVSMATGKQLTGTARYASVNAMRGCTQSRRDDLEAIAHVFIYCLRGSLPWSGLDAPTYRDKLRLICEKKAKLPLDELCKGHPDEFKTFLDHSRNMRFEQRPDYDGFIEMFRNLRRKTEPPTEDWHLQWLREKEGVVPEDLVPLQTTKPTPLQPEDDGAPVMMTGTSTSRSAAAGQQSP